MAKLFAQEVPEIYDGVIEIKSVARDPGSRAKIAVISQGFVDRPGRPCIGMRGSRVQAVVGELQGEKIDIIQWNEDDGDVHRQRAAPAEVAKVVLDEDKNTYRSRRARRSAVAGDRPSRPERALGLAADGLGHRHPDRGRGIRTPQEGIPRAVAALHGRLDVDDVIAHLLVTEGFSSVEEVAYVEPSTKSWSSKASTKTRQKKFRRVPATGYLEGFDVGRTDAEEMILAARILLGWIDMDSFDEEAGELAEDDGAVEGASDDEEVAADDGQEPEPVADTEQGGAAE
jgi:N utilization substance protein A